MARGLNSGGLDNGVNSQKLERWMLLQWIHEEGAKEGSMVRLGLFVSFNQMFVLVVFNQMFMNLFIF